MSPSFSTRSSLSAASCYPWQAEARSWAAAEAAEAAAAQLRQARRDAAEEKDAALQAISDMRAQMVAQQAAAEAALLDSVSRRCMRGISLAVTGVAGPAGPHAHTPLALGYALGASRGTSFSQLLHPTE